uniref:Uncharacterized protein n=1 Tax=Parascaris univalens TaxID=6257 RepID=A0A914ZD30_PARUN
MREAQLPIHGSSSSSTTPPLRNSIPSQLDPGRLGETRIERSHGSSLHARPRGSGGGSSLLKQAIANRMNPEVAARRESKESKNIPPSPLAKTNAVENVMQENAGNDKNSCGGFRASSMESVKLKKEMGNISADENDIMNRSVMTNPAWYRDDDGRTGFKPKEWEGVKGEQRSQVKDLSKQSVNQRSENQQPSNEIQLKDFLTSVSPEWHSDQVISKSLDRSKARTALQRDGTTSNDQRVKTGMERVVHPVLSENTKLGVVGRGARLAKMQKEQLRKRNAVDDMTNKSQEQIKSRQDGAVSPDDTTASEGLQKQIQQEQPSGSDVKSVDSICRSPPKPIRLNGRVDEALHMTANSSNSDQQEIPNNNVRPQIELTYKQDRTTEVPQFATTNGVKSEQGSTSGSSIPNQNISTHVNGVLAKRSTFKDQACSPSSLGPEISDRRDSSLSESSRLSCFSHKSVTFSDRVEVTEIERREKKKDISNYKKYLENNDETSDEEERFFFRPLISPRRQLRGKQISANTEEVVGDQDIKASTLNEDSLKYNHIHRGEDNEGRLEEEEGNSNGISLTLRDTGTSVSQGRSYKKPAYDASSPLTSSSTPDSSPIEENALDSQKQNYMHAAIYTDSQRTLYEGDIYGPDRVQYFNDEEYDSLENLPISVRQAIIDEHTQQLQNENYIDDQWIPLFGSMSRLHNTSSHSSSTASFPMMPRSASGYFDISPENDAVEHAVDNHKSVEIFESEANMEQLQTSYYENVPFSEHANNRETALTANDLCNRMTTRRSTPTGQVEKRRYDSVEGSDDSTIVEEPPATHAQVDITKEPSSIPDTRICSSTSQPTPLHVRTSNEPSLQSTTIKHHDGSVYETSYVIKEGNRYAENHAYSDASRIDFASRSSQPSIPSNEVVLAKSQDLAEDQQEFYNPYQRPHEQQQSDISQRDDGTFDANLSKEERLRLQFVARFGSLRAPIERMESDGEEYPIDPNHRKPSYDSMASSNSRESVVSAASVRAEILLRRNFNY